MGAGSEWVNVVDRVLFEDDRGEVLDLVPREKASLDQGRIETLYRQLGPRGAVDVVCRAIEERAVRLAHCARLWRMRHHGDLRKSARSLVAISDQIGMTTLARVARDVTEAIDCGDDAALSATLFRLIRIGERSLAAVWDLQDLSL